MAAADRHALVIGASRGLGLEFARQYRADGWAVTASARDAAGLARLAALGAQAIELDVANAESCSRLGWQLDGRAFDVLVINAGVFGPEHIGLQPPSQADFDRVMHTNVLGPMRLIGQLADVLAPRGARLAVLSSGMGSIGDRKDSFNWLYSASKAALNSVLRDASMQLAGRAICIAMSPGWVRTDMGGPGAPLEPEESVRAMRALLARLKPSDNGRYLGHEGRNIAW